MNMKIYHNARCSKSRKALEIIKSRTSDFEIIEYLKRPLKFKEIKLLLSRLNKKPIELIRTKESIWKERYQNKKMNDDEIIRAIINHPKLMQRPIIKTPKKTIIGRDPENVIKLFN